MSVTLINTENSIKGGRFSDLLATNNFANRKWELFLNTNETSTLDTAARMIGSGVISTTAGVNTLIVLYVKADNNENIDKNNNNVSTFFILKRV